MVEGFLKYLWDCRKSECSNNITSEMYSDSLSDFLRLTVTINNKDVQIGFFQFEDTGREHFQHVWFEKHKMLNYLIHLISPELFNYTDISNFHINSSANFCSEWLYRDCGDFDKYYMKWVYLILLQANKNFKKTRLFSQQNSEYIQLMIYNFLNELEFVLEDYLSINNFRSWLLPSGVMYKRNLGGIKIESVDDIYSMLFDEIMYIKANYQMCIILEDNQTLRNLLQGRPYI